MTKKNDYQKGRLGLYIQNVVDMIKLEPDLVNDTNQIAANLLARSPELTHKEKCANCGGSMKAVSYYFDSRNAELLVRIAKEVREKVKVLSLPIFEANQTYTKGDDVNMARLANLAIELYYFNLLDKVRVTFPNGRSRMIIDTWKITKKGWLALSGVPFNRHVKVWKNGSEDSIGDVVSIADSLLKSSYDTYVEDEWYEFYSKYVVDK